MPETQQQTDRDRVYRQVNTGEQMSNYYIETREQSKQTGRYALPEATCSSCGGSCKVNRDGRPPRCRTCAHNQHGQDMQEKRKLVDMVEPEPMARIEIPVCTGVIRIIDGKRGLFCQPDCPAHPITQCYPRLPLDYSTVGIGD